MTFVKPHAKRKAYQSYHWLLLAMYLSGKFNLFVTFNCAFNSIQLNIYVCLEHY